MHPTDQTADRTPDRQDAGIAPPDAPRQPARRRFLTLFSRLLLALWGVGVVAVVTRFLRPRTHHMRNELVVPDADLEGLDVGSAMLISESDDPIHLVRVDETDYVALSATCTHLRCILQFDQDSRTFICPCHRGQFDLNGNVLGGLPSKALARYRAVHRLGEVVVVKT